MGGDTTPAQVVTQTSSSAPANPNVTATVNKLLGGINTAYDAGPSTPNYSQFQPAGAKTQGAWASSLGAANNPDYANSVNSAIKSFGNVAAGNAFGMNDPGYAALRAKAGNDAQTQINGQFNNSGRLGGGSANIALGEGVGNALAGMDYQNYQNDIARQQAAVGQLGNLYGMAQQPGATQGAVGAAQDANQQGILSGQYDLDSRKANQLSDLIARLTGSLSGNAQTSGMTTTGTTTSPGQAQTPWWQSLGGLALGAL